MPSHSNPYIIVTKWAYPFGGGEQYMRQTMHIMCKHVDSLWLCFNNARNEIFLNTKVVDLSPKDNSSSFLCKMICVSGGFSERKLYCWLRMLNPALVHCQGALKTEIERVTHCLNLPLLSGFHFWHGLLLLDEKHANVRIKENIQAHSVDPMFRHTLRRSDMIYGPSLFFNEIVKSITNQDLLLLSPMPDIKEIKVKKLKEKYVVIINIHESKGGKLFHYLLQNLPNHIKLMGVRTDVFETELDRRIDELVSSRPNSIIVPRSDDVREIYAKSAMLLQPSECDETFCRVLVEAHANNIATLSSDYGNLPYLHLTDELKERCVICGSAKDGDYYAKWQLAVEKEYEKLDTPDSLAKLCLKNYEKLASKYNPEKDFLNCYKYLLDKTKLRNGNVALFSPWCDQGLGIQTRNYAVILRDAGFKVFIFAFLPYTGQREQANPQEWNLPGITVYYSKNHREKVERREVLEFALKTRIKKAIIPETCWHRVFSMMNELRSVGVLVYAVPNVEIVRCDEIEKHLIFDKIFLNNRLCEKLFLKNGFSQEKLRYVNYSISNENEMKTEKKKTKSMAMQDNVRLLILGGRNAISRKHVDIALRAFLNFLKRLHQSQKRRLELIATSQIECPELCLLQEEIQKTNGQVELKLGNLSALEIEQLYETSHIVMQISKHEGLGIGFFEALAKKKPIITLNIEPHNECAPTDVAWYIQPDAMVKNTENNSCWILSAQVSTNTLEIFFETFNKEIQDRNWWKVNYLKKVAAIDRVTTEQKEFFYNSFLQEINGFGKNQFQ